MATRDLCGYQAIGCSAFLHKPRFCIKKVTYKRETKFALDEINRKDDSTIFMVPVRLANVEVPHSLEHWHSVDLFKDDGYQKLQRALIVRSRSLGISRDIESSRKRS